MQQSQQFVTEHMAHLDDKSDDNIVIFQTYTLSNRYRYRATNGESYLDRDYTPIYTLDFKDLIKTELTLGHQDQPIIYRVT